MLNFNIMEIPERKWFLYLQIAGMLFLLMEAMSFSQENYKHFILRLTIIYSTHGKGNRPKKMVKHRHISTNHASVKVFSVLSKVSV